MKIYTRTGDTGETSLLTGERVPKDHTAIEALGAIDECNSAVGMAIAMMPAKQTFVECREQLTQIQQTLLNIGAAIAGMKKPKETSYNDDALKQLESWIDHMEEKLPSLKTFIIPGGHPASATLHLARSLCRRAERQIITLNKQQPLSPLILNYLNRLSDHLFVAARTINHL